MKKSILLLSAALIWSTTASANIITELRDVVEQIESTKNIRIVVFRATNRNNSLNGLKKLLQVRLDHKCEIHLLGMVESPTEISLSGLVDIKMDHKLSVEQMQTILQETCDKKAKLAPLEAQARNILDAFVSADNNRISNAISFEEYKIGLNKLINLPELSGCFDFITVSNKNTKLRFNFDSDTVKTHIKINFNQSLEEMENHLINECSI